jgi:hypothetical protein
MPNGETIIGKMKCRITGKVFPIYKYIQLKSGLRMYQVTPEDCEEKADYIAWGTVISLCQKVENKDAVAFGIAKSSDLLSNVEFPPNLMLLPLGEADA